MGVHSGGCSEGGREGKMSTASAAYLVRRAAQKERVRILYRRALKDTLNWAVHRHLFYPDVTTFFISFRFIPLGFISSIRSAAFIIVNRINFSCRPMLWERNSRPTEMWYICYLNPTHWLDFLLMDFWKSEVPISVDYFNSFCFLWGIFWTVDSHFLRC